MATGIESLFNIPTSQALQQAYIKQQQVSPDVLAQLDLTKQGVAMARDAGASIGMGLGRLFGGSLPGEVQADQMRQAMSGISGNTQSERMLSLAQQLQNIPGMEGQAALAAQKAAEFKAAEDAARIDAMKARADISKKYEPSKVGVNEQGQTVYSMPDGRGGYAEVVQTVDETGSPTYAPNTLKIVSESALGITPTQEKVGVTPQGNVVYRERTPSGGFRQVVAREVNGKQVYVPYSGAVVKEGGTSVNVSVDNKGLSAYAQTVGKGVGEKDLQLVDVAETASESIPKIQQTLTLLKEGDPTTGIGQELFNNVNRLKAQFLNDKKAGKQVTDTQLVDALLGSDVFPMIGPLGIGARGLDTPGEREFLQRVFTGTLPMEKNTLIRLTEIRQNIAQRAIDKYNKKLSSGDLSNFEKAQGRKLNPITVQTVEVKNW